MAADRAWSVKSTASNASCFNGLQGQKTFRRTSSSLHRNGLRAAGEIPAITPSERAALQLVADGEGLITIARHLGMGESEVDAHLTMLFARMGAADRSDAVTKAFRRGLLRLDGKQRQDEA
jgi:DNA-binding NarL/FixJ family response regulator